MCALLHGAHLLQAQYAVNASEMLYGVIKEHQVHGLLLGVVLS